jgi:hypothetical protein
VNDVQGWVASLGGGFLLWMTAGLTAGARELWDVGAYWSIFLPLALLLCGVLGFVFARRAWRWPLAVMVMQLPALALTSHGDLGLFPVTLIWVLILSIPGTLVAYLGVTARRRVGA